MDQERKIHDVLFISDKIITYKTAAAILNVGVNEAKAILQKYVKDHKDDELNVSYVVGGITSNNIHKLTIVIDKKYDDVKLNFSKITVDHIYSIQKTPLTDWIHIFNVDDFLYDKNDTTEEVEIKQEKLEPKSPVKKERSPVKNSKVTQPANKKGSIATLFSQSQSKSTNKVAIKKELGENATNRSSKSAKPNALTSFMSKNNSSNKENTSKAVNNIKEELKNYDSDEDEEIVKTNKKRARVINDDDEDDDTPTKCVKVDILDEIEDEPMENDQIQSDEDMFGSPETEKEEQQSETEETKETKETVPSNETQNESTNNKEEDVTMYQDDEGFFVTEKKPGTRKRAQKSPEKKETKAEIAKKDKVKKEVIQKIKKNTNQNTLLTYFQKK